MNEQDLIQFLIFRNESLAEELGRIKGLTQATVRGQQILSETINDVLGKMSEWIPVSERLPEDDETMLVTCRAKNGNLSVNRAFFIDGCWIGSGPIAGVTAWMPLPEPYREEDET